MFSSGQVIEILQRQKSRLHDFGVTEVGLFGSFADNTASEQSDIDVLIDFTENSETYSNLLAVCELLENSFRNKKVDVVTKKGLSPFLRDGILSSVRYV